MADFVADRLAVLHGLRLKGFAEADAVAALTGMSPELCAAQLSAAQGEDLVLHREGRMSGWMLTPAGRAEVAKLLAEELDACGAQASVEDAYGRFLSVNGDFLAVCTDWQMTDEHTLNDHADPNYDAAVIARLGALDDQVQQLCADIGAALGRFGRYGNKLAEARQKVEAGATEWFTKPMIESYHTVWFELHEDLLATLAIERSREVG